METVTPSVVVLERCRHQPVAKSYKKSPKFCCVCGGNVSHTANPVMTGDQLVIFNRCILHPPQELGSLQKSRWICAICLDSVERVEFVNGEMVRLEKVLKELIELLRLKIEQHSFGKSVDLDLNCLEPDFEGDEVPIVPLPEVVKEEEVIDMDTHISTDIEDELELEDYAKPVVEDEVDIKLNPLLGNDDFDEGVNLEVLEDTVSPPSVLNCTENDQGEPVPDIPTSELPSPELPLMRSMRRSKLRANQMIRSLSNHDHNDKEDVGFSETEYDEDDAPSVESSNKRTDSSTDDPDDDDNFDRESDIKSDDDAKTNVLMNWTNSSCKEGFATRKIRDQHRRENHDRRPASTFVCNVCQKAFQANRDLSDHKKVIHEKIYDFPCDQCDYKFPRLHVLRKHIAKYHGSAPPPKLPTRRGTKNNHYCQSCQKGYAFLRSLQAHIKRVHDTDKTFKCGRPNCRKTFYNQTRLDLHLEHYHPENEEEVDKTRCGICQEKFPNILAKMNHVKKTHSEKFACSLCKGLEFCSQTSLRYHTTNIHGDKPKPHLCSQCGQRFSNVGAYNWHMDIVCNPDKEEQERNRKRRNEAQKKYRENARKKGIRCKVCSTLFSDQRKLDIHIGRFHGDDDKDVESSGSETE